MIKKFIVALALTLAILGAGLAQEQQPEIGEPREVINPPCCLQPTASAITWQVLSDPSSQITQSGSTVIFAGHNSCSGGANCAANMVSNEHFPANSVIEFTAHGTYSAPWLVMVQPVDHSRPSAANWSTYNPNRITPYFNLSQEMPIQDGDRLTIILQNGTATYQLNGTTIFSQGIDANSTAPYEVFVQFLWYSPAALRGAQSI